MLSPTDSNTDFSPFTPTTPEISSSANQSAESLQGAAAAVPISVEPIYGKRNEDKGVEVQFSVELTRIHGLIDVFHLDIRRGKGDLRSYQFIYNTIKEYVSLSHLNAIFI
jgi:protein-serine/threonine kinase